MDKHNRNGGGGMIWKYSRIRRQDDSEVVTSGNEKRQYVVGRLKGRFRLALFSWQTRPFKWKGVRHIFDFSKLHKAKEVAELLEADTK